MTYTYDHGAAGALRTLVARGYQSILSPLLWDSGDTLGDRGPYLRTVTRLPAGPLYQTAEGLGFQLFGALPALYVVPMDSVTVKTQPNLIWHDLDVDVYVVSGIPGALVEGRLELNPYADSQGDDPGIDVMIDHVTEMLNFSRVTTTNPATAPIRIRGCKHVYTDPEKTCFQISTTVEVQQFVLIDRDAAPLDVIEATHDPTGGGAIATQRRTLL